MIRTAAHVVLVFTLVLAGCNRYHTRAQGPFGKPATALPPPYGSLTPPRPVGNASPLGIASADVAPPPLSSDEPALIPSKGDAITDARAFPPRRRPNTLPSPFAPKGAPEAAPAAPTAAADNAKNLATLKALLTNANTAWKAVENYETTLTRRELNPKGVLNSEVLVFQFRREPMSVFTRTISESGKGREVVYNRHEDKMHVMLGQGDSRLARAGFIAPPVSPDDSRVKEKARYSIRDAGFGRNIGALSAAVSKVEAGQLPAGAVRYDGEVKRTEFPHPVVGVTHTLRPGDDPLMPAGGSRVYFFDMRPKSPAYGMPVLVIATDPAGKEAEYYLFEKVKQPAGLTDTDFDPARLGKKR